MNRRNFLAHSGALLGSAFVFAPQTLRAQSQTVVDDAGRSVSVPSAPKRIVSMYEALLTIPALELGLAIQASYGRTEDGGSLMRIDMIQDVLGRDAKAEGITGIGPLGEVDLEKIRSLEPDLILASELDLQRIGQLEKIAPTFVLFTRAGKSTGFEAQSRLARLLGREVEYDALYAAYQSRVSSVRESILSSGKPDPRQSSAMMMMARDQIGVLRDLTGGMQALRDLGYAQATWSKTGQENAFGDGWLTPLSAEEFPRLDPDLMIVIDGFAGPDNIDDFLTGRLDAISPGWSRFSKPHKDGKLLLLQSAPLATTSIASAMHMLDRIEDWAVGSID